MVAVMELVALAGLALLGFLWFRRTPIYKARRSHHFAPGQQGSRVDFGVYQPSRPTPPPAALHEYERPRRKWRFTRSK
jgi:hypothetical protein